MRCSCSLSPHWTFKPGHFHTHTHTKIDMSWCKIDATFIMRHILKFLHHYKVTNRIRTFLALKKVCLWLYVWSCTGKIRVFCRIRPLTLAEHTRRGHTIVACLDDYSVILDTLRGPREFQFDKIFNSECTQEEVFMESSG